MDSTDSDPQAGQAETPDHPATPPQPEPESQAEPAPPVVAALAPQAGVGPTLRHAREKAGKNVAECAKLLRIRQAYLEALEEGRHADLPGGTYAAGFLRSYAEFLGLDSEEMVRRFREEGAGGFKNRTELTFPSPVSEGRIPGGAVIFLGLILAAVVYGGWYLLSSNETKVAEMVPPIPDRLAGVLNRQASLTGETRPTAEAGKPAEEQVKAKEEVVPPQEAEEEKPAASPAQTAPQASPQPEPAKVEPPKVEAPKVEPAKPEPPKVEAPKPEPRKAELAKPEPPKVEPPKVEARKAEPPKADGPKVEIGRVEIGQVEVAKVEVAKTEPPPPPASDGKVYGTEHGDSRVVLKATGEDCWVQVREMDGSLLMSRLLRRGDSYRVPNRAGLTLMVGNAGSLEVSVDGRRAPPLGSAGQVRRDIRLDPERLASGG